MYRSEVLHHIVSQEIIHLYLAAFKFGRIKIETCEELSGPVPQGCSLCFPRGRNTVSEKYCRSTILVNFWKNLHVRTLVFFRYFRHFLPQTFNLQTIPTFTLRGLCTFTVHQSHMAGTRIRNFLSIDHFGEFLEKFACPDLQNFSTFFLKLYANIHTMEPLYIHCTSHMAGTRFLKFFVY